MPTELNPNRQVALALATQQDHKAADFFSNPELGQVKRSWWKVGDVEEPKGTNHRNLGIGKKDAQKQVLDLDGVVENRTDQFSWILASMDVTMWYDEEQLNKPDLGPWDYVESLTGRMLGNGKEVAVANIMTIDVLDIGVTLVGWREATIKLPHALVYWLSQRDRVEQMMSRGWVDQNLVTGSANGGMRWDLLPVIWGRLRGEMQREVGDEMVIGVEGANLVVGDVESAIQADKILRPFLRGVAPGMIAGALGRVEMMKKM